MAYSKQTWTDDVSAVTATRMTHIEQGIYDNSLATDKINPSGTATTTAEIEEGQISDVIGFKSLKLKGQTSQYTTTGSQLFDINNTPSANKQYVINNGFKLTKGTNRTIQITLPNPIPAGTYYISADVINSTLSGNNKINVSFKDANNTDVVGNVTFLTNGAVTTTAEVKDLYFFIASNEANTATITLDNIMLNSGSTKKDFEKYTGSKASPNPDFPQDVNNVSGDNVIGISNKNLFNKNDFKEITGTPSFGSTSGTFTGGGSNKCIIIPCRPSTSYTAQKRKGGNYDRFAFGCSEVIPSEANGVTTQILNGTSNNSASSLTITTASTAKYLIIQYYRTDETTLTKQQLLDSIQVETGTSATSYTAHQGNNFDIDLPVENLWGGFVTDVPRTIEGITYTNYEDGSIKAIGTATANSYSLNNSIASSNNHYITLPAGTYTLSGATKDCHLQIYALDNTRISYTTNTVFEDTFTLSNSTTCFVRVEVISGRTVNEIVYPQIEKGTKANKYTPYRVTPIYQGKIGTYCNDIRKYNGKWYWHKEIEKLIFNGTENWSKTNAGTENWYYQVAGLTTPKDQAILPKSNYFTGAVIINSNTDEGLYIIQTGTIRIRTNAEDTVANFKTWLSTNTPSLYYVLATPIDEEITYTPLIRQLDELYNSGLYDVTNISQDNSSEAFILDLEACKNNINGIVEYIRR